VLHSTPKTRKDEGWGGGSPFMPTPCITRISAVYNAGHIFEEGLLDYKIC
jgi:hypothetical protein